MTNNYNFVKAELEYRHQQIRSEMTKGQRTPRLNLAIFKSLFAKQPKPCCQAVCCTA